MVDTPDTAVLEAARAESGLTMDELWLRYFELTGEASILELEAYLQGALVPSSLQFDMIAQALNERFMELGMDHPVPYRETSE
ncbi:MAG TPA: hypothetical protein VHL54_04935 [Actinomycetota bacterium]|nr:hypothetical protein [Actinomycetota bacterium]